MQFATGPPGCEYGDKLPDCVKINSSQCKTLGEQCCQRCHLEKTNESEQDESHSTEDSTEHNESRENIYSTETSISQENSDSKEIGITQENSNSKENNSKENNDSEGNNTYQENDSTKMVNPKKK
jgi:hypothetical protein